MHRDQQSRTLLHHAVSSGSKEVVRYLLDHGELCSWGWGEGGSCQVLSTLSLLQHRQRSLMLWRRSEYLGHRPLVHLKTTFLQS